MASRLLAAACHVSPITLSAQKTIQNASPYPPSFKTLANLVVFPEPYIPAFPGWIALLAPNQRHDFFERVAKESIYIDSVKMNAIRHATKQTGNIVCLGISEKLRYSTATLFNSNAIIEPDGNILVHHRKLMQPSSKSSCKVLVVGMDYELLKRNLGRLER